MSQRMFVGIVPPEPVREDLAGFLEARSGMPWMHPEQWHLTLAFLASVDEHRVDDLVEWLTAAAARRQVFPARLGGAGCFPYPTHASVLWLAAHSGPRGEGATDLRRLAVNTRSAANAVGAATDGKAFVPHLTVARLRRPIEATKWLRVLDTYQGPDWDVTHVDLVASYLGQGPNRRPRYETVASLPLRDAHD
jgi:2'-5' RNA ligase